MFAYADIRLGFFRLDAADQGFQGAIVLGELVGWVARSDVQENAIRYEVASNLGNEGFGLCIPRLAGHDELEAG